MNFEDEMEDMIKKVEKSINSIDFEHLGREINDTVNRRMNQAVNEVKKVWKKKSYTEQRMDEFEDGMEDSTYRYKHHNANADVKKKKSKKPKNKKNVEQGYAGRENIAKQVSFPVANIPYGSISGMFFKILGGVGVIFFGFMLVLCLGYMVFGTVEYIGFEAVFVLFWLTLCTGVMCYIGISQRNRVKRFRDYVQIMNGNSHFPVEKLAAYTGQKKGFVTRDLEKMIQKDMFPEGHLDQTKTDLILDHQTYELYLNSLHARKERELEAQKRAEQLQREQEVAATREKESEDERVERIFQEGQVYIKKIREANDAIPEEEISSKLFHLENVTNKIFEHVRKYPNKVGKIEKFMEYYLPTTLKLVSTYQELNAQPIEGENINQIKKDIEDTLDTINTAFEKLLDGLFEDEVFDIYSDISVLETVLRQEGLAEADFKLKDADYEKM